MGTSFDCAVNFRAVPATGQLTITIGPFDMGNLAELLDYLGSEEFRDTGMNAAAEALTTRDNDLSRLDPMKTAEKICQDIQAWQIKHQRRFMGTVFVSVKDVPAWQGPHPSQKFPVFVGQVGTVWGVTCMITDLPAGEYRLEP